MTGCEGMKSFYNQACERLRPRTLLLQANKLLIQQSFC
ncbi:hypothetical protein M758_5G082700 [Ceratodon purpureus]|nr:hypothetical protein M758_5G082700 [Ceratodon purpureus]